MTGLIKLLVEEMEELLKKQPIIHNGWRITNEEQPDPIKYPVVIVYDYWLQHSPRKFSVKNGNWTETNIFRDSLSAGPVEDMWSEFWKPYNEDDTLPSNELIERFERLYKKN